MKYLFNVNILEILFSKLTQIGLVLNWKSNLTSFFERFDQMNLLFTEI